MPRQSRGKTNADKPTAPMNGMPCLKRVFTKDIETCSDSGGTLRVIVCVIDPPLIAPGSARPNCITSRTTRLYTVAEDVMEAAT